MENVIRVRRATDNNVIWHMCFACWITKAAHTHSEQWFDECASVLHLYVHSRSYFFLVRYSFGLLNIAQLFVHVVKVAVPFPKTKIKLFTIFVICVLFPPITIFYFCHSVEFC